MENIEQENNINKEIKLSSLQSIDESLKFIKKNNLKNNKNSIYDIEMNPNSIPKKQKKKYGRLIILYIKDGDPIYVMGELFPFCFIFNFFFIFGSIYYLYGKVYKFYIMLGFIIGLIQIILYTFSGILNPGLPKLEYEKLIYEDVSNKNFRQCKDCKFWINTEFSTQHCNECNVCIEGYDHHCSTLNLCIGKDNLKIFYFYILASFIFVIYFIIGFLSRS